MPAAAVIHRGQALSGIIGRKGCVGGRLSPYGAALNAVMLRKLGGLRW